jgi:hypothetical protein
LSKVSGPGLIIAATALRGRLGAHSIFDRTAEHGGLVSSLFAVALAGTSFALYKYVSKKKALKSEREAESRLMQAIHDEFEVETVDPARIEEIFEEFERQDEEIARGYAFLDDPRYDSDSTTPEAFICPITLMIIRQPVIIQEGAGKEARPQAYELSALTQWYHENDHHCSPTSRTPLPAPSFYTIDPVLRMRITDYVLKRSERVKLL